MSKSELGAKDLMRAIIDRQSDDASFDEILRQLAFRRMVGRGLRDALDNKSITTDELRRRFKIWQT